MEKASLSLPPFPPLKGGEVVKVDEGLYALILEPLVDEPGAYRSVPFKEGTFEMIPVDLLVHEELIKEVVGRAHPLLLEVAREAEKLPVGFLRAKDDEVLRRVIAVQWGSEFCLTEPWQRVVVCRKATILINKEADLSLLKFSRFGEASLRELPSGELEVVLTAGAAYVSDRYGPPWVLGRRRGKFSTLYLRPQLLNSWGIVG
jgi:hypothetical protein